MRSTIAGKFHPHTTINSFFQVNLEMIKRIHSDLAASFVLQFVTMNSEYLS